MKKSMRGAFHKISLQQGDASENYFQEILQSAWDDGKVPPWFLGWSRTLKYSREDMMGIDFVIKTDRGPIMINVKSSRSFAKVFETHHKGDGIIPFVVNLFNKNKGAIFGQFISTISPTYKQM